MRVVILAILPLVLLCGCSSNTTVVKLATLPDLTIEAVTSKVPNKEKETIIRFTNEADVPRWVGCTVLFQDQIKNVQVVKTFKINLYPMGQDSVPVPSEEGESLAVAELVAFEVSSTKESLKTQGNSKY
jgi:hypothetical protein